MSKKNKFKRIKLIANPGAGDAKEEADKLKLVTDSLENKGLKVDLVLTKPKEEATPVARRASRNGYKVIVAMGGDGTVEAVMRGMIGSKSRLGIIPSGTANNVAKSLGIPLDLEEACDLIASGKTLKLDIGRVKTKNGKKFHFFEMATVGLSAAIYPDLNKVATGKLSHIKDTAATFFHQETKPTVYLTFNNESKDKVETMLVMVSNTPTTGKGFKVAPQASMQDGLLDISVYPEFNKVELVHYYASIMDGGYSGDKKVQHYQARKLKIKSSPKLDVMADGVALGKGTVKIKVQPGALRVITNGERPEKKNSESNVAEILPEPSNKNEKPDQGEEVAIKVG
jgi:diacylglycerol kinase (ATP)